MDQQTLWIVAIIGTDINETVNNINAKVQELGKLLSQETAKIDRLVAVQDTQSTPMEYLINTVYERPTERAGEAIRTVVSRWVAEGWTFKGMSSDYQGIDGVFLLFERPSTDGTPGVHVYNGSDMTEV